MICSFISPAIDATRIGTRLRLPALATSLARRSKNLARKSVRPPAMSHPTRLTLDVVMDDFPTRRTGVYGKPVWVREGVLQVCVHARMMDGCHAINKESGACSFVTPASGGACLRTMAHVLASL